VSATQYCNHLCMYASSEGEERASWQTETSRCQHLVRSERGPLETSTTFRFARATAPSCPSVSIYPGLRRRRRHHATRAPPAGTTTSPCRAPTGSGGRHEKAAEPAEGLRAARPALASPASHCVQSAARATAPAALDVLDRWMDRQPAWGFRFPAAARWATCPPQQPHALTAAA